MHIHSIPIHPDWTIDETLRWLDQSLLLPNTTPTDWVVVECFDDDCRGLDDPRTPRICFPDDDEFSEVLILGGPPYPQDFYRAVIGWMENKDIETVTLQHLPGPP